ncbi:VG15 protein [Leifsonia poae]|uniref:VG15 protein n=1 Tax=Leifsonia poae TaxID=110933 RepID=UPI001CBD77D7|nr:hypothetical protein [Leifsonia poae]
MPSSSETRAALQLVTGEAVTTGVDLLQRLQGTPEVQRLALLDSVPGLIGYYADGSAALAADYYDETRALAGVRVPYTSELVIADRTVKIRRAIAWSAEPLFTGDGDAGGRLAEVIQIETARPFRDTITTNRQRDPEAVGWRRVTSGGCKFCRMLADKGAVYREGTARFAAHPHCHCTAEPVFGPNDTGESVSAMQYLGSKRRRTPEQQATLRDYLDTYY